jgi:uncharacterized repeat protein (TIGR03847 family)
LTDAEWWGKGSDFMAQNPFDNPLGSALEAEGLRAEAVGEPGQRRFRLLAVTDGQTTIIWMEKQQLQALGLAMEQLVEDLPDRGPEVAATPLAVSFDPNTRRQFRAGRMELGYDERRDRLVIVAHDINVEVEDEEAVSSFGCRLSRDQARELSADVAAVVAAGRPRCTMCGAPMGPEPHVCPQQNGHYVHALEDTEPDDDP